MPDATPDNPPATDEPLRSSSPPLSELEPVEAEVVPEAPAKDVVDEAVADSQLEEGHDAQMDDVPEVPEGADLGPVQSPPVLVVDPRDVRNYMHAMAMSLKASLVLLVAPTRSPQPCSILQSARRA